MRKQVPVLLLPLALAVSCGPPDEGDSPVETEGTIAFLELEDTDPTDPTEGARDVPRDVKKIRVKYKSPIDCNNPLRGIGAFRVYALGETYGRTQAFWDNMDPGRSDGKNPLLSCDVARNAISLPIPGPLVGGMTFNVETNARGADGSTLVVNSYFTTANPGLKVVATTITNLLGACDTDNPFANTSNCDVYIISQAKAEPSASHQFNVRLPAGSLRNWSDWPRGHQRQANTVLYQDARPVGDPFVLELQAFDADGDGLKKVLEVIGGIGEALSTLNPDAPAQVLEGVGQVGKALPANGDDNVGVAAFYFSKQRRWGTEKHTHQLVPIHDYGNVTVTVEITEEPPSFFIR